MDRGPTSAMARWRQRRGGSETDPLARGGDSGEQATPTAAAPSPHFFRDRQAASAAGFGSALSRRRQPRWYSARRGGGEQPDLPGAVAAPMLALEPAAETKPAALPEPDPSAGPSAVESSAGPVPLRPVGPGQVPATGRAETAAPPPVRGAGQVAATLRGQAASAIARWQQRRRPTATPAEGLGVAGRPHLAPVGSELSHDALRLLPAVVLCVIGIALTYGVCVPIDGAPERLYWRRQIAFLVAGLILYALIGKPNNVPLSRRTLMRVLYALLCVGLPVLVLLLGHATGNGVRWLSLFGVLSVQPAEFAKIALIWVVAELINPDHPTDRIGRWQRYLLAVLAVAVPVVLVFLERSMGNTALLCLSVGTVLVTRWFSWPILLTLLLAVLLGLVPVGRAIIEIRNPTPGIDLARLAAHEGHLDPERIQLGLTVREVSSVVAPAGATGLLSHCPDRFACYLSEDGGWNARQALRCVRLGGRDGSGYRSGNITILGYLPRTVQHTDFIYCVLSESFGFWGALVVLGLIAWLIVVVLWSGAHSRHAAAWSFSVGFATLLFLQTVIHVGMALRILPIIGIPLPFVSYGGSFLVTSFAALGLVARYDSPVALEQPVSVAEVATDGDAKPADQRFRQPDLITA